MKLGVATSATTILQEWHRYLVSQFDTTNDVVLKPDHKDIFAQNTINSLLYQPTEAYPTALLGWMARIYNNCAYTCTTRATNKPASLSGIPNLGELLYLLLKHPKMQAVNKIIIPIALEMTGTIMNCHHWVLGVFEPKQDKLTIIDSKVALTTACPIMHYTIKPIVDWVSTHPFAQANLSPIAKPSNIQYVMTNIQGVFNQTDCGHYMLVTAKKLIECEGNVDRLATMGAELQATLEATYPKEITPTSDSAIADLLSCPPSPFVTQFEILSEHNEFEHESDNEFEIIEPNCSEALMIQYRT